MRTRSVSRGPSVGMRTRSVSRGPPVGMRTRSVSRAYGGRTASLSPTAFPTKVNCYSSCFPLHRGSSKGPSPGKTPGVGPFLFIGKMPSLLFCHVGLSQSLRCNVLRLHCPAGSCKRPCSGPACRWHRLCNSSRCQPSPRTASSAHRHCRR